jgi:hypothetical protein
VHIRLSKIEKEKSRVLQKKNKKMRKRMKKKKKMANMKWQERNGNKKLFKK